MVKVLDRQLFSLIQLNIMYLTNLQLGYRLCGFRCALHTVLCMWIIRTEQRNVKIWQLMRLMTKKTWFKTIVLIHIYVLRNAHKHSTNGNVTRNVNSTESHAHTHSPSSGRMYEWKECDFYMDSNTYGLWLLSIQVYVAFGYNVWRSNDRLSMSFEI